MGRRKVLTFEAFKNSFERKVRDYGISWELVGFYSPDGKVYPFGTDTKVISTVFEALVAPLVREIAEEYRYEVEGSEQTVYPDFTLSLANGQPPRIAIDVKTTYRRFNARGQLQSFRYTLGSYTSFLRSPGASKNIKYPYEEYAEHWVIGFLYTRREGVSAKVSYDASEASELLCPYQDVEYFVQQKYRIVGLSPASGNTTNIGSFPTSNIRALREGQGPFAAHDKDMCDEYWRYYPRERSQRGYSSIEEFLEWKRKNKPK